MDETPIIKDGEGAVMLADESSTESKGAMPVQPDGALVAFTASFCVGEFIVVWADSSEAWRHQCDFHHATGFGAASRRAKYRHDLRHIRTRPIEGVVQQF